MQSIFQDETKLKILAQIQDDLCLLEPNTDEKNIDNIISKIPPNYLTQREELLYICKLFAMYSRISIRSTKSNSIKLFEKIINSIKTYIPDESQFFWSIFGGLYYFKLWMYEEGLISIETIIQSCINSNSLSLIEYFLPEIIEKVPEVYHKEFKYRFKEEPTKSDIEKLREKRKKYFKFLKDSKSFTDTFYEEIEKDPLRLSIKRDDIETFQRIISNTNLPINTKIKDEITENFHRFGNEVPLIQYAIEFNSIKIFHFLIMNDAKINDSMIWSSIFSGNYELIHFIENKMKTEFQDYSLANSISCWKDEITEYTLNNYDKYDFFFQENLTEFQDYKLILDIFRETFYYYNLSFFSSTLLPFLQKNEKFVEKYIDEIIILTFSDTSCFFLSEFIKSSIVNINYFSDTFEGTLLGLAIKEGNTKAVEILLENPEIDVNKNAFISFPPLIFAIAAHSDKKILDLLCNHSKIDLDLKEPRYGLSAFDIAASRENFYALKYIADNQKFSPVALFDDLIVFCLREKFFFTMRIILEFFFKVKEEKSVNQLMNNVSLAFSNSPEIYNDFKNICDEININKS